MSSKKKQKHDTLAAYHKRASLEYTIIEFMLIRQLTVRISLVIDANSVCVAFFFNTIALNLLQLIIN